MGRERETNGGLEILWRRTGVVERTRRIGVPLIETLVFLYDRICHVALCGMYAYTSG